MDLANFPRRKTNSADGMISLNLKNQKQRKAPCNCSGNRPPMIRVMESYSFAQVRLLTYGRAPESAFIADILFPVDISNDKTETLTETPQIEKTE